MKFRLLILVVFLLANVALTVANAQEDCDKDCGYYYPYIPFLRNCGVAPICSVSECVLYFDGCGYTDPHNDICDYSLYGCYY